MDLDQAVWVFDTSCKGFAPDQRRAWNTIRAKLVEGQKPSTNMQIMPCPRCGVPMLQSWSCWNSKCSQSCCDVELAQA